MCCGWPIRRAAKDVKKRIRNVRAPPDLQARKEESSTTVVGESADEATVTRPSPRVIGLSPLGQNLVPWGTPSRREAGALADR
jgi:hypothetical protein